MNETKIAEVNLLVRKNSRNELVRLCKEKNMACSGTKHDMAVRLIGGFDQEPKEKLVADIKKIVIKRNTKGQWEYDRLIFDDKTKNVIGCLDEDNTLKPLQRDDIEKCKQHKFRFVLPNILDERTDIDNKKSHELSSDEDNDADDDDDLENNED
jgi:hypothetical protein